MVHEYFVEQVRAAEQAGIKARAALKTKADAEAYVRDVREKIRTCFGPFPEKTPLNARVTGMVERDAYDIEKVIFESRPDFLVTANLYVPKGRKAPAAGRGRLLRPLGQRQGGRGLPVVRPGAGPAGLRRA